MIYNLSCCCRTQPGKQSHFTTCIDNFSTMSLLELLELKFRGHGFGWYRNRESIIAENNNIPRRSCICFHIRFTKIPTGGILSSVEQSSEENIKNMRIMQLQRLLCDDTQTCSLLSSLDVLSVINFHVDSRLLVPATLVISRIPLTAMSPTLDLSCTLLLANIKVPLNARLAETFHPSSA